MVQLSNKSGKEGNRNVPCKLRLRVQQMFEKPLLFPSNSTNHSSLAALTDAYILSGLALNLLNLAHFPFLNPLLLEKLS